MTAWIVRAGLVGERDNWALQGGQAGGGFHEIEDLAGAKDRAAMKALVSAAYSGEKPGKIANFAGQLWALSVTIGPGDLIVLPLKTTKKIAIGVCTSGYKYRAEEAPDRRHTIGVDWKVTDIPRLALKDDLLNTVNGAMTIFQASKRDAAARLQAVLDTGTDPGFGGSSVKKPAKNKTVSNGTDTDNLDTETVDPSPAITVEAIRDRVRTYLVENFGQHKLTGLVAEILRAQGYTCDVSPAGPDFGVDILAGRGPLGLDSPTVVVGVKSEQARSASRFSTSCKGRSRTTRPTRGCSSPGAD